MLDAPTALEGSSVMLTPDAARVLTEEVKADAAALWAKLLRLYEGGAHAALGYDSWADYCAAEFDWSDATAYRLLGAANVVAQLPIGSPVPATESVARELVPVLRESPEDVPEVWGEVIEEHGETPTAAQVREVVERHVERPSKRKSSEVWSTLGALAGAAEALNEMSVNSEHEEAHEWLQSLSSTMGLLREAQRRLRPSAP